MGRVLLLDTSAFIMGYEVADVDEEHYTVPAVREELMDGRLPKLRFDNAVRIGRLKVVNPDSKYIAEVGNKAIKMGEEGVLSNADIHILALGLHLRVDGFEPIIVSDDYSVQNVANSLSLGFRSFATPGIKRRFEWIIYCPGCHRTFRTSQPEDICPICGTGLRRRPGRKRKIMR